MKSDFKILEPSERASLAAKFALNNVSISHDGPQCEKEVQLLEVGMDVRVNAPRNQWHGEVGMLLEIRGHSEYIVGFKTKRGTFYPSELVAVPDDDKPSPSDAVDRILADTQLVYTAIPSFYDQHLAVLESLREEYATQQHALSASLRNITFKLAQIDSVITGLRELAQPKPNEQEEKEKN